MFFYDYLKAVNSGVLKNRLLSRIVVHVGNELWVPLASFHQQFLINEETSENGREAGASALSPNKKPPARNTGG